MERNIRTTLQGIVVSNKMAKTIVVEVETHKRHAKYAKRVKYSNRYYAHDEKDLAKVGDTVTIMACRPLSATKRFRLISVDKKAVISIKAAEAELALEEKAGTEEIVSEKPAEVAIEVKAEPAKKAPAKKAAAK
jgi:small subunit ribosomal protein S17